jgi:hypothetical protein
MSTVASNLFKLATRIDPVAKGTSSTIAGQKFKSPSDATAITGATYNGTLIRLTSATHGLTTGQYASVYGVAGTTGANNTAGNPAWVITAVDANTVELQGSTFNNAYSTGGTLTGSLVGSVDGARFTRGRLLDIYNEARFTLWNAIYETKSSEEISKYVYGSALTANLTFAYSSPYTSAAIPSGYIRLISLYAYNGSPVVVFPNSLLQSVQAGGAHFTTSATNLIAFQLGANFSVCGSFATELGNGSSSHYATLNYYGMSNWTWATDVLPGTTVEVFSPDVEPILIEIACAIADEQSNSDTLALAKTLLNKKA